MVRIFEPKIFKAYDIRGLCPKELDEEAAYNIGRAFVTFLKPKTAVVGKDMRTSTPKLAAALISGVTDQGCDVIDIGLCSTPMLYFAVAFYKHDGAVMVTASHNPKEYNGFKLTKENARPIGQDSGIMDIKDLVEKGKFPDADKKGKVTKKDISNDYKDYVLKGVKIKKLKVVIDAANGMGALEAEHLKALPLEITPLFFELDGSFPNHEADPIKVENLKDLSREVVSQKADLGIAFDGDGDRVVFVDENGTPIPPDLAIALIAKELLQDSNGEKIIYDLRSSRAVRECIKENGGIPIMWKVGHAFMKEKMRKENALFGGELAGHYFFRDYFFADSTMLAVVEILKLITKEDRKLSEIVKPLRKYWHSGEINSVVRNKDKIIEEVEKRCGAGGKVTHIDGVRIDFKDYWISVRKSNTEPLLRLIVEADTKERMEQKRDEALKIIRS